MINLKFNTLFVISFVLFNVHFSFSQAPEIEWQKTIGGNNIEYLRDMQPTSDGGCIMGGEGYSSISGDLTEPSIGGSDYLIIKLDSYGVIEWQHSIGGGSDDYLKSLQQTLDGGYILGGYSGSGISGEKTEGSTSLDYWVIKLNADGGIEWQNTIGGNNEDILTSISQTTDNGYILAGSSKSGISGDKSEGVFGSFDYWVVKLNSSGIIEWQKTIGGDKDDSECLIQQTADGGYFLGGYSVSGISGNKTVSKKGENDYWIIKLNNTGDIEWQKTIGGNKDDLLEDVLQTGDGYLLGGTSVSDISGDKTEESLVFDYWIVKINNLGFIEWQNTIGGNATENLYSLQQTYDGGYLIGGASNSDITGDKTEANFGISSTYDYWVVKLNSSGEIEWDNTIGGTADDILKVASQTADGGYLLAGWSRSNISGVKTEASWLNTPDFWVVKLEGNCLPSTEVCNSLDDNCNGLIDDDVMESITISADGATTFCQGSSVLLSAIHSGTSLQWKKNGVDIIGATSDTYTATKTGDYTCVTTSLCGNATSTVIPVVMNKKPNAVITADGPTNICFGDSVTLIETPVPGCSYQWYNAGVALAGETSTTYVATYFGNYNCRVTKIATGCFKKSNIIYVGIICKEENNTDANNFSIYPNPAADFITIQTEFSTEKTIYLTNALGQILQTINTSENTITIDINNISSGVYYIRMEDGGNAVVEKFVKR